MRTLGEPSKASVVASGCFVVHATAGTVGAGAINLGILRIRVRIGPAAGATEVRTVSSSPLDPRFHAPSHFVARTAQQHVGEKQRRNSADDDRSEAVRTGDNGEEEADDEDRDTQE